MNTRTVKLPRLASADNVPRAEEALVASWERNRIFERSVEERPAENAYVFYEGPPTANGKPGVHHVIARLCKDFACRYHTMRGQRVVRKAGWDTHGLPVEIEVEKELGIKHKDEIEVYGIAEFNKKCRESVFKYEKDWVAFTRRIGYWLDLEHPYVTYHNRYIESVWWILKEFWNEGLIYRGHKSVPFCPRCETSLSSHEVSLGYKDVSDPSVFVKFKRREADEYFLAWTTTPWTLTCNAALAVAAKETYARVRHKDDVLILAQALLGVLDGECEVLGTFPGAELVGAHYEPLFDFYNEKAAEGAFRVVPGDFVSLEDGTGIVHIAPAFGADDYRMHREFGVPLIQGVRTDGTFEPRITPWAGKFIKDADPSIIKWLKDHGLLYKSGTIKHSYPFCWRCGTPLMYYARPAWYIRTTSYKDRMIEANNGINWIPKEVGEYRFGNWLENNVDWSLSRERYWGTPLNLWVCNACGETDAVGSINELQERALTFPKEELDLHRPFVDAIELSCRCGGVMQRVKDVIDVWFDSGAMPFAQYHHPWDEENKFATQFPADYICEGIDQSRGWFYSLLAISVFVKGVSPYKNVLTTELILDKHGQKMSKSKGNAVEPWEVLNEDGADALRWYLVTTSPPWSPTRFDRDGVKDTARKMLENLRNVYAFYALYAGVDGYVHSSDRGAPSLLDRWILSRYHTTVKRSREWMDAYDVTRTARAIERFVLDEVSNWYVRRSRRRFWKGEMGPDKTSAYHTLHTVLDGVARLMAPIAPFLSDEVHLALRGLTAESAGGASVHLEAYPEADDAAVDAALESRMDVALSVVSLGRTIRNDTAVKVRQPLSEALVHSTDRAALDAFLAHREIVGLVTDELNVRTLRAVDDVEKFVSMAATPNFPVLGKKFGKRVPRVAEAIKSLGTKALAEFMSKGVARVDVDGETIELGRDDLSVRVAPAEGYGAHEERGLTVILNLAISEELRLEGMAREVVNRLQNLRKSAGLDVTDRIRVRYQGGEEIRRVFDAQGTLVASETLAEEVSAGTSEWKDTMTFDLEGEPVSLWIAKSR
jgi:isoleucyl-tRNA synthetase